MFIHCQMGISRSASVALAYIMCTNRWHFLRSLEHMRSIRPYVSPNPGFRSQLRFYQRQLVISTQFPEEFDQRYHCLSCQEILFEADDILHKPTATCSTGLDISEQDWMNYWEIADGPGTIHCYRCSAEVGTFSLTGRECGCGEVIKPSFCMLG